MNTWYEYVYDTVLELLESTNIEYHAVDSRSRAFSPAAAAAAAAAAALSSRFEVHVCSDDVLWRLAEPGEPSCSGFGCDPGETRAGTQHVARVSSYARGDGNVGAAPPPRPT